MRRLLLRRVARLPELPVLPRPPHRARSGAVRRHPLGRLLVLLRCRHAISDLCRGLLGHPVYVSGPDYRRYGQLRQGSQSDGREFVLYGFREPGAGCDYRQRSNGYRYALGDCACRNGNGCRDWTWVADQRRRAEPGNDADYGPVWISRSVCYDETKCCCEDSSVWNARHAWHGRRRCAYLIGDNDEPRTSGYHEADDSGSRSIFTLRGALLGSYYIDSEADQLHGLRGGSTHTFTDRLVCIGALSENIRFDILKLP